jgi:uncharacterized membrane protein YfcA
MTSDLFVASSPMLVLLGFLVGMLGTLVGAGGGFILVPMLVFLLPAESADRVTAISMAVVFFNALSGTVAYARMRRIDWASGWRFAAAALPGALLGAVATAYVSRLFFDRLLGGALVAIAAFLAWRGVRRIRQEVDRADGAEDAFKLDAAGRRVGAAISAGVGFVSSVLGIGGGIIHVPALVYILGYPVHIATATSHFVLACTSLIAVAEHIVHGSYDGNGARTAVLAAGAVIGAQVGARLSSRIKGPAIVRCLAAALAFAGCRIIWRTLGGN